MVVESAFRPQVVVEATAPAGNAGFKLTPRGQYTKAGFVVTAPDPAANPAMQMTGRINVIPGSPGGIKIFGGFIQRVSVTHNTRIDFDKVTFHDDSPAGSKVPVPDYFKPQDIPSAISVNDAPKGSHLYGGYFPFRLGIDGATDDTPEAKGTYSVPYPASDGRNTNTIYTIKQNSSSNWTFMTWLVVGNYETDQWVPLRQRGWTLTWDTSQAGPWTAAPAGAETAPVTQPPPDTTKSAGNYMVPEGSATFRTETK